MIRNELTASKTPFSSLDAILDASRRLDEMKREKAKNSGDELLAWYQETTPSYTWTWPWQRMVLDHLKRVASGELKRLIIEVAPRMGKTELVSIRFPIYLLEKFPGHRVAVGAHGQKFANRFGRFARNVAKRRQIPLSYSSRSVREWETDNGGVFRSFGIGSPPMGEGFNTLILDDVIRDKAQAYSVAHRDNVWDAYASDLRTRLEPNGAIIWVMHRWHHDDPIGRLERTDDWPNWTVLRFPALAEENDILGRQPGESLCPERFSEEAIRNVSKTMTSFDFSARYQQRAIPIEGAHFRREWFKECVIEGEHYVFSDGTVEVRNNLTVALYVDPALGKKGSDNTGIMAVAFAPSGRMIVLEAVNRRIPIAKLPNEVARIANQWGADWVSMEANGFQIETMSRLRADHPHLACRELQPGIKNKLARAQRAIVLAEQGNIYLSDHEEWQDEFLIELTSFTGSGDENDACVDCLAYSAGDQHQFIYDEESKPKSAGGMQRQSNGPARNLNRGRGGNVWRQF